MLPKRLRTSLRLWNRPNRSNRRLYYKNRTNLKSHKAQETCLISINSPFSISIMAISTTEYPSRHLIQTPPSIWRSSSSAWCSQCPKMCRGICHLTLDQTWLGQMKWWDNRVSKFSIRWWATKVSYADKATSLWTWVVKGISSWAITH